MESYDEGDGSDTRQIQTPATPARLAQAKKIKTKSREHINATVFSMCILLITEAILLLYPTKFWVFYIVAFPILMLDKYMRYKPLKYHLFLLDFCYVMNSTFLASLIAWEVYGYRSCETFKVMFWCAFGPIANALWLWRNSLVLYDVDKLTSTALHILPPFTAFVQRFHQGDHSVCAADEPMTLQDHINGWIYFTVWQAGYFLLIEVILKKKIRGDPELWTSVRWMFKNHDSMTSKMLHWPFRMCGIIGKDHFMTAHSMRGRLSYVLCQLIFIGLSTMAMGLFWNYYWVSIAFMIGVLYIVIQNGASFSAHQFAKFVWKELSQK